MANSFGCPSCSSTHFLQFLPLSSQLSFSTIAQLVCSFGPMNCWLEMPGLGEGPGADLSFLDYNAAGSADAGSTSAIFVLASVKFKKKKNEMIFTVFPQVALADLITGTGECEVAFDTACVAPPPPPPPEPLACEPYSDEARTPGGLCVARYAGGADGAVAGTPEVPWLGEPRGLLCNAQTGGDLLAVDRADGRIWAFRDLDGDGKIAGGEAVVLVQQDGEWMRLAARCESGGEARGGLTHAGLHQA